MSKKIHALITPFCLAVAAFALPACSAEDPSSEAEGIDQQQEAVVVRVPIGGHCNSDGVALRDGRRVDKGVDIGADATGISVLSPNACHGTGAWSALVTYACHQNSVAGATFSGSDPNTLEYFLDGTTVNHPAATAVNGLWPAFVKVGDSCGAGNDFLLVEAECCKHPATP